MKIRRQGAPRERGSTLVVIGVLIVTMSGLILAMLAVAISGQKEVAWSHAQMRAFYAAEAAAAEALAELGAGGDGVLGAQNAPLAFAGADYWVAALDLGDSRIRLTANAVAGLATATVEVVVEDAADPLTGFGIFGDRNVELGSNARIDSYDSRLGDYASQVVNKHKGKSYASGSGHVGSNASIDLSSNAVVFGDATPGPGGTVIFSSNAFVLGSTTPSASTLAMSAPVVPSIATSGDLDLGGNATHTLGPGDFHFRELFLKSNAVLNLIGPMNLVVDDGEFSSNTEVRVDAAFGQLTIYATGDFTISSNSSIQSADRDPQDVTLVLTSDSAVDGTTVDLSSNGGFYGTIYGPLTDIELDSNFALFGALRVRSLRVDSNATIHLDEALMSGGGGGGELSVLTWRLASMGRVSP
jgi:hypothetical protein